MPKNCSTAFSPAFRNRNLISDDERNDLLELKRVVEQHLSTLHDELIELSSYDEDDVLFNALLVKAKYYREILARIDQQVIDENE